MAVVKKRGFLCRNGLHKFEHCKCIRCGERRDSDHVWNGCKCSVCGKVRDRGHQWNGCQCTICRSVRDEGHRWDGCVCRICGRKREEGHLWDGCLCKKCGAIRSLETDRVKGIRDLHDWDGCTCRKCGMTRNIGHTMPPEQLYRELSKQGFIPKKLLEPILDLKFQCLRCKRNITLKGGKKYCPKCLVPVTVNLLPTDSPTILQATYECPQCGFTKITLVKDGY